MTLLLFCGRGKMNVVGSGAGHEPQNRVISFPPLPAKVQKIEVKK